MTAGAVVGVLYVLAAPVFSAFRLELVLVPMAAWGLALADRGGDRASCEREAPDARRCLRRSPTLSGRPVRSSPHG